MSICFPAEILLKLSLIFDKDEMYKEKYVISRACAFTVLRKSAGRRPYGGRKNSFSAGIWGTCCAGIRRGSGRKPGKYRNSLWIWDCSGQNGKTGCCADSVREGTGDLILSMSIRFATTAACFTGSRRMDEAEEAYKRALILDSKNVDAHCGYGILLSKRGKKTEANYHYTQALELDPDHVESNFRYARLLEEKGEPLEAEKYYIVALKAEPENPKPHLFYARLLADHGIVHGARVHFRYALKKNPGDVEAHCEYARLLARFGHRHEAEVQYKKALELDPGHFGTLCGYGDLLKEKGQYAEAKEIYRQAEFFKRSA